jgi:hypothetical protein
MADTGHPTMPLVVDVDATLIKSNLPIVSALELFKRPAFHVDGRSAGTCCASTTTRCC